MTFSIVAWDPETGDLGVAVQSKFLAVGPIVPWAKANVGAIATQSFANTSFGYKGLELLEQGLTAAQVLDKLLENDPEKESRQIGIVDNHGNAVSFTGKECFAWAGHLVKKHFAVQGNILISQETINAIATAYQSTEGDLPQKLLAALAAADHPKRGDARGQQSAALLVVRKNGGYGGYTDRWIDIRVDDHETPIKELARIFKLYDMTFLTREDPSNLLHIHGTIAVTIKRILVNLNYLPHNYDCDDPNWDKKAAEALEAWIGINNFENKWRDDGRIWKSIYEYMCTENSTPFVSLKKMSD